MLMWSRTFVRIWWCRRSNQTPNRVRPTSDLCSLIACGFHSCDVYDGSLWLCWGISQNSLIEIESIRKEKKKALWRKSVETIEKGILFNLWCWVMEMLKVCSFFVCLDSITKVLFISCCWLLACGEGMLKRKGISSYYGKRNNNEPTTEKKSNNKSSGIPFEKE